MTAKKKPAIENTCALCKRKNDEEEIRRNTVGAALWRENIVGWKTRHGGCVFTSPCERWTVWCNIDGDYFTVSFSDKDGPKLDVPRLRITDTGQTIRSAINRVLQKIWQHCKVLYLDRKTVEIGVRPAGLDAQFWQFPKAGKDVSWKVPASVGNAAYIASGEVFRDVANRAIIRMSDEAKARQQKAKR